MFNSKIINKIFILLKRFKQKNIITSLTHGDFKLNHLFLLNNNLECVVDWEDVGERSIFYDLLNFFVPWFLKRSYNYFQIKNHICQLVKIYSPNLSNEVSKKYDLYFLLFSLERYNRIKNKNFNEKAAFKRYNILFNNLIKRLNP